MISMEGVGSRQRKPELIGLRVDGVTATAAISFGGKHATITDNGTGDYTLTLVRPARQTIIVVGCISLTAGAYAEISSATSSAVRVLTKTVTNSPAAVDALFHLTLLVFRSPTEY